MKINKIYADQLFKTTKFNKGLSVILGEPKDRANREKDTHNLGKTLLLELIDFLLLKGTTKAHFLKRHARRFSGYHFFLELKLNNGKFLTIRRGVEKSQKISIKVSSTEIDGLKQNIAWDYEDISIQKEGKRLLNDLLGFDVVSAWNFRKSVSYFLRSQKDFSDVFQLEKYKRGGHSDWKPFLFNLIGFESEAVKSKYELDERKKELQNTIKMYRDRFSAYTDEFDKLRGAIQLAKKSKQEIEKKVDDFDFYSKNKELNTKLVEELDYEINTLHTIRYNITEEISQIEKSLNSEVPIVNLKELKELYEQVEIYFPNTLMNEYHELEEFNKNITQERNKLMNERLQDLKKQLAEEEKNLKELERQKRDLLAILKDKNSYYKFKEFQKDLAKSEADIARMEERLSIMNELRQLENQLGELQNTIERYKEKIRALIEIGSETYERIRETFSDILNSVLNTPALISITQNNDGNIDFEADFQDPTKLEKTAEGYGTTYKKLLCMAFDLSVLIAYSKRSFYRFVYHDGALETLDDRKKINFLNTVREICQEHGLQYIITVIDSDIPHDETDEPIQFGDKDVVLRLHDRDDSGRLFEMSF